MPTPLPESSFLKEARAAMPSVGSSTATRLGNLAARVEVTREAKQQANEILHEKRCAEILAQREVAALQKAGESLAKKQAEKAKKLKKNKLSKQRQEKRESRNLRPRSLQQQLKNKN